MSSCSGQRVALSVWLVVALATLGCAQRSDAAHDGPTYLDAQVSDAESSNTEAAVDAADAFGDPEACGVTSPFGERIWDPDCAPPAEPLCLDERTWVTRVAPAVCEADRPCTHSTYMERSCLGGCEAGLCRLCPDQEPISGPGENPARGWGGTSTRCYSLGQLPGDLEPYLEVVGPPDASADACPNLRERDPLPAIGEGCADLAACPDPLSPTVADGECCYAMYTVCGV